MGDAILLQNGGHVGFGNIIQECTIPEENVGVGIWGKLAMPVQAVFFFAFIQYANVTQQLTKHVKVDAAFGKGIRK